MSENENRTNKGKEQDPSKKFDKRGGKGHHKSGKGPKEPAYINTNDISWYAKNDQLLKDAASLAFGTPLGITLKPVMHDDRIGAEYVKSAFPGILVTHIQQTVGGGETATDALTVIARKLYQFVRHANSGRANYEAPDLMFYIIAVCSAWAFVQEAIRVYSAVLTYKGKNRYYGEAIVRALGWNYSDVQSHAVDLRAYINMVIQKMNSIYIPKDIPLLAKWQFMNSALYKDANLEKAQLYAFVTDKYYKLDTTTEETGTSVVTVQVHGDDYELMTFSSFRSQMEEILLPIYGDEDCGIMGGDLLKAFTASGMFQFPEVPESMTLETIPDMEVLDVIHNSVSVGKGWTIDKYIQASTGVLKPIFNLTGITSAGGCSNVTGIPLFMESLIDLNKDAPEAKDVMLATRLKYTIDPRDQNSIVLDMGTNEGGETVFLGTVHVDTEVDDSLVQNFGSEVVRYYDIFYVRGDTGELEHVEFFSSNVNLLADYASYNKLMMLWVQFDYAPIIYSIEPTTLDFAAITDPDDLKFYRFGETFNAIVCDDSVIKKCTDLAILTELTASSYDISALTK